MDLCEKGDARNVGITNLHLREGWDSSAESNVYSAFTETGEMMAMEKA